MSAPRYLLNLKVTLSSAGGATSSRGLRLESCSLSVVLVFATVRNEVAKPCPWAVRENCLQDDVCEVDFLANRIRMLRLATCVEVVCVLRGRRNALEAYQCCRVLFAWQA